MNKIQDNKIDEETLKFLDELFLSNEQKFEKQEIKNNQIQDEKINKHDNKFKTQMKPFDKQNQKLKNKNQYKIIKSEEIDEKSLKLIEELYNSEEQKDKKQQQEQNEKQVQKIDKNIINYLEEMQSVYEKETKLKEANQKIQSDVINDKALKFLDELFKSQEQNQQKYQKGLSVKPQIGQQKLQQQLSKQETQSKNLQNNNYFSKPKFYSKQPFQLMRKQSPQKRLSQFFKNKKTNRQQQNQYNNSKNIYNNKQSNYKFQAQQKLQLDVQQFQQTIPKDVVITPTQRGKKEFFPHIFQDLTQRWYYLNEDKYRSYQFDITKQCLIKNTLVCLPTGLGKTFVAINVILNFYKWFPSCIIMFLAPTRPLVTQQKNSLKRIEQIKNEDIYEITGTIHKSERKQIYQQNGIFFMTPQTLNNDIKNKIINPKRIVLIIYDEAHKAKGKYAYNTINQQLISQNINYRVVALSATPGNSVQTIQKLIKNLSIAEIQVRSERDKEIQRYIQNKNIYPMFIKASNELTIIMQSFEEFLLYAMDFLRAKLKKYNRSMKIPTQGNQIHFLTLQPLFGCYRQKIGLYTKKYDNSTIKDIDLVFKLLFRLSQAKKYLKNQGIQIFRKSFENVEFFLEQSNEQQAKVILKSQEYIRIKKLIEDDNPSNIEKHPKMQLLNSILDDFFSNQKVKQVQSKVIIFTHNRINAQQIQNILKRKLFLRPSIFIGQNTIKNKNVEESQNDSTIEDDILDQQLKKIPKKRKKRSSVVNYQKGMNQQKQREVLNQFKNNEFNILIATCVAEEGLDIGEVDLIICYDSGLSPTRLVQRMGRTGRKRNGSCILLLSKNEQFKYNESLMTCKKITEKLKQETSIKGLKFYDQNPRMIPITVNDLKLQWLNENKNDKKQQQNQKFIDTEIEQYVKFIVDKYKNLYNQYHQYIIKFKIKFQKLYLIFFSTI